MLNYSFEKIMSEITLCWSNGDYLGAYSAAQVILTKGNAEMKAQCLLLCGMVKDDEGSSQEAREMWIKGVSSSQEGTFVRYSLENAIGKSYLKVGNRTEALRWGRLALNTCVIGNEFSGNQALSLFVEVMGEEVPDDDRTTIIAAIEKTWKAMAFEGKPDLSELPKAISEINKRSRDLFDETTR